jgi:hypothetical protein
MGRLTGRAAVAVLLVLNIWMVGRLFLTAYTVEMWSIEAAYISLAHYILHHFSSFTAATWFPLWYGGIPSPDSYPPLLHIFDAALAYVLRISPALAYHGVCATVYSLTPVVLYWTARRLGAGVIGAFAGGLCYSLLSASCFLIPEIREDSLGWFGPRRLENLAHYGEGPLQFSFLFLLLALGLIHLALERRRPIYFFGAGVAIAAVPLSNWIGGVALALTLTAYLLSGLGGKGNFRWYAIAAMGVFAYALAMPWITPSVIATIRAGGARFVGFELADRARWIAFAIMAAIALLAWLLARWRLHPRLRFGILFALISAAIPLANFWGKIEFVPQPWRYPVLMDLAVCFSLALALPVQFGKLHARAFAVVLIALAIPAAIHERAVGRPWTKRIDIQSTVQFEISTWLGANMPGQRVFGPGSIGSWMDAFSDTPMLTGGFDNGVRNLMVPGVNFQIYYGDSQELALAWMKAFGVDAVIACEKGSREVFNAYRFPDKFKGLKELWRHGGDVIYAVPRGTSSLAHALLESDLVQQQPLAYEGTRIARYLQALEDPSYPPADFRWTKPGAAVITADLSPEHLISAQITCDEGWRARVHNQPRRIWADNLGQIAIAPQCAGPCTVVLTYDGTPFDHLADIVSLVALAAGALWVVAESLRRRISKRPSPDITSGPLEIGGPIATKSQETGL